jgi:hypothetical protein
MEMIGSICMASIYDGAIDQYGRIKGYAANTKAARSG